MRSAKLILNPAAGRGQAAQWLAGIKERLASLGVESDIAQTRAPREAVEIARRARQDGFELIIAAGGDGTVHEAVSGLVQAAGNGTAGTLGIIPIGSGNDFVRNLGLPTDWQMACDKIAAGQTRRVDLTRVNGEISTNSIGVGFQAQVNLEARKINWVRGSLIYIAAVVVTLRQSYRTPRVVMTLDGQTMAQDITDITLGNGRWSGGGSYLFTPEADLADGFLDVCVARGMSKLQIVMLTPKVMRGAHVGDPLVKMARARRITIKSEEPLPVHADGELLADAYQHEIVAEVLPQKLEVIA